MDSFEDLVAWQVGMELVDEIYRLTRQLPKQEQFGLTSQMRRAATSIVANIAEGFCRHTYADKAHKYTIARGEIGELKTYLLVTVRQKFLSPEKIQHALELAERTGRLLSGLITSSKKRSQ